MVMNVGKLFLVLCVLTIAGGVVANAQVGSAPVIEANLPFDFMVGDTTLPAGKYQIKTVDDNSNNVLEIRSAKDRKTVMFNTEDRVNRDVPIKKTQLVFNKVGDQHFLFQIWVAGSSTGNQLLTSSAEKKLTDAGYQSYQQTVVAVLKR